MGKWGRVTALLALAATACSSSPSSTEPTAQSTQPLVVLGDFAPADATESFGYAVALGDGEVFVGERDLDRVMHYVEAGGTYVHNVTIEHPPSVWGFGRSLVVTDTHLFVGDAQDNTAAGAIHVYQRVGADFVKVSEVLGQDDVAGSSGTYLGRQIVMSGTTLVSNGNDGVHVFDFDGTDLNETQLLAGLVGDLTIDGDTLAAGEAYDDTFATGVVRVFRKDGGGQFQLEAILESPDVPDNDPIGSAVTLSGDSLLTSLGNYQVVDFHRVGTTWTVDHIATISTNSAALPPGEPLRRSGDFAVYGNRNEGAYLLALDGGQWVSQVQIGAIRSADILSDRFAYGEWRGFNDDGPGAAHVVGLSGDLRGRACTADADCLSGFCASGFCCNSRCNSTCEVCAAALGAPEDGTCGEQPGAECCQSDDDCPADTYCENEETNTCVDPVCTEDVDCDDGDPCTIDMCSYPKSCSHAPDEACGAGAGSGSGAGPPGDDAEGGDEGGCGCRVGTSPRDSSGAFVIFAAAFWLVRRRRSSRTRGAQP